MARRDRVLCRGREKQHAPPGEGTRRFFSQLADASARDFKQHRSRFSSLQQKLRYVLCRQRPIKLCCAHSCLCYNTFYMIEIFYLIKFVLFQVLGLFIALGAGAVFVFLALKKAHSLKLTILLSIFFLGAFLFFFLPNFSTRFSQYPFSLSTSFGPADGPSIPLKNILTFFKQFNKFEKVANIARDPNDIPPPISRDHEETIKIEMETKEVVAEIAPGIYLNYWTFGGQVPGPFVRVREGDTVELTLKNSSSSIHMHSIDLHAVTGPGGGATVTDVGPGESKTLKFKALNPGLYVYHCAHPNVPSHMTHG